MAERPLTARMVQKRDDSTITLNVYDVVDHPFHYAVGKWLSCGIHHSGIQVDEREFAFTLEGIVVTEPHKIPRCRLTHQILLTRNASDSQVRDALSVLQRKFTAHNYDPLTNNCNHFSDAFCALLNVRKVPGWVNRAPSLAAAAGTRFRLKPPRVTAPSVEWSLALAEASPDKTPTVLLTRINDEAPAVTSGGPETTPEDDDRCRSPNEPRVPSPRSFSTISAPPAWAAALASDDDDELREASMITAPWRPPSR
mmetsp:Transcript_6066/g.15453  ORF Transcript_6066/g.15453 Transcript_6066/m.15453 type:complete len:254 (+) Transcript_6066:124-885(+)